MAVKEIKYTHIFADEIDRVYKCFSDLNIALYAVYPEIISDLKGTEIDLVKEGLSFSFRYKNYYDFEVEIIEESSGQLQKNFKYQIHNISQIPGLIILLSFSFFWDSCQRNTVFVLQIKTNESFFYDLIEEEINQKDFNLICSNTETYLKRMPQDLFHEDICVINAPIKEVYSFIKNWQTVFDAAGNKKIRAVYHGEPDEYETVVDLYSGENVLYTSFIIKEIYLSDYRIHFFFYHADNKEKILPHYDINIALRWLDKNTSAFSILYTYYEFLPTAFIEIIGMFSKKVMKFLKSYYLKKQKK